MNINDLRTGSASSGVDVQSDNIVNINLKKKQTISAEQREQLLKARRENAPEDANFEEDSQLVGRDLGNGRREFVPASAGIYDAKREEYKDDIETILDKFDNEYLPNKLKEIEDFNAALDMAGELTEEEVLQMQGKEYVTKVIEDPKRLGVLKTHEMTDEEAKIRYEQEQEILKRRDEMERQQRELLNKNIDYNPDHYKNLPGMEEENEPIPVGSVEDLENPVFDKEDENDEVETRQENSYTKERPEYAYTTPRQEDVDVYDDSSEEDTLDSPDPNYDSDTKEEENEEFILPQSEVIEEGNSYGDEFDKDEEDESDVVIKTVDDDHESDEQILERFKRSIRDKIKPVTKAFNISTYTVVNKAIPFSNAVQQKTNHFRRAKWALMSTGRPITIRSFKSTELDEMNNTSNSDSRYMTVKKQYSMIFDHIEDPKPKTVEEWAKVNSFLDLEHIWFAIYRACFEGANYIPRDCIDTKGCRNVFLTDDTPIMDMVKFKDKDAKKKFFNILNKDADISSTMYVSEITPVSDDYAIAFREPSIYNIVFESALVEEDFLNKYQDLVSLLAYVDSVYRIDHTNHTLIPVNGPHFNDNVTKTYKARIKTLSKVIDTLSSDQYRFILAIIDEINKRGDEVTYVYPEVTCPKCNRTTKEQSQSAQSMVFLRHQLVALAI